MEPNWLEFNWETWNAFNYTMWAAMPYAGGDETPLGGTLGGAGTNLLLGLGI